MMVAGVALGWAVGTAVGTVSPAEQQAQRRAKSAKLLRELSKSPQIDKRISKLLTS